MDADRAARYVRQALERLDEVQKSLKPTADEAGLLVSLRRNLESAAADLPPAPQLGVIVETG